MNEFVSAHILVKGLVQGIGYRYFVRRVAQELNLTGWVRNLPDADVEVIVEGEKGKIKNFITKLQSGHPWAKVDFTDIKWNSYTGKYNSFEIKF